MCPSEEQLHMFGGEPERLGHPLFTERWGNRKAFWIGLYTGHGLSAPAIEKALGEQDTANTIAHMVNFWGYRLDGEQHTHGKVRVPLSAKHRTMLADEAMNREMSMPELCRRILVQVAQDDMYRAILEL
jgi:hypothetical protein